MEELVAGVILGVIIGRAQEPRQPTIIHYPQVVVVQPRVQQLPQVIHTPGIMCPQGTAPMYEPRYDHSGRHYFSFIGCR